MISSAQVIREIPVVVVVVVLVVVVVVVVAAGGVVVVVVVVVVAVVVVVVADIVDIQGPLVVQTQIGMLGIPGTQYSVGRPGPTSSLESAMLAMVNNSNGSIIMVVKAVSPVMEAI